MLAVYASTNLAPLASAWVASMALRFFSTPRRYGTSSGVIGSWGQQPGPLSGRIARYGTTDVRIRRALVDALEDGGDLRRGLVDPVAELVVAVHDVVVLARMSRRRGREAVPRDPGDPDVVAAAPGGHDCRGRAQPAGLCLRR